MRRAGKLKMLCVVLHQQDSRSILSFAQRMPRDEGKGFLLGRFLQYLTERIQQFALADGFDKVCRKSKFSAAWGVAACPAGVSIANRDAPFPVHYGRISYGQISQFLGGVDRRGKESKHAVLQDNFVVAERVGFSLL